MRLVLAILMGTLIAKLIRFLKIGGGTAAPGLYALRIEPNLVEKLGAKIPKNVVITGTNGKTTTARMLAHFAKASKLQVIRNHTGSNLERGIASTLINSYSHILNGSVDLGIWELDEAAFNTVAPKIKPDIVVFLNVFRDQLDRYGEVDSVVKNWCQTLTNLPKKTAVLVNGDDVNTRKLPSCFKGQVQKFGVKDYKIVGESLEHIKETETLDFEAGDVKSKGLSGISFRLIFSQKPYPVSLPIPGIYHIYDFLGAFATGLSLGFKPAEMISSLKNYSPAFGRVERLDFGYIFLIKNPAGATQVLETITPHIKPNDRLLLALNDNIADGKDVSWIWDANFESFRNSSLREPEGSSEPRTARAKSRDLKIYVSGTRAYDLAVRLKYAGIDPKEVIVESDLKKALQKARGGLKGHLFILPTYTAMLELQRILTRSGLKKHYWEEDN